MHFHLFEIILMTTNTFKQIKYIRHSYLIFDFTYIQKDNKQLSSTINKIILFSEFTIVFILSTFELDISTFLHFIILFNQTLLINIILEEPKRTMAVDGN